MSKHKAVKLQHLFLAPLTLLLSLILIACPAPASAPATGGAVAAEAPPAPEEVATEAPPTQEETTAAGESAPPQAEVTLEFWLPVGLAWMSDMLQSQIDSFTESNPTITVEIVIQDQLLPKLEAAIAAGNPPAVAALDNGVMHYLNFVPSLLPLDDLRDDDFLPNILEDNTFNSRLNGLPWVRFGCTPSYLNLIGFIEHPNPNETYALINHLTQPGQQTANYDATGLLPTRQSAYGERGIECPPMREVLLSSPTDRNRIIEIVQERAPNLQAILDQNSEELRSLGLLQEQNQTLNPFLATAAITYDEQFPDQETIEFEDPSEPTGTILTVAAPVVINFSAEEFEQALSASPNGVIVGAFFGVDGEIVLEGDFLIEKSKDYAVKWRAIDGNLENIGFYLIDANDPTTEIEVGTIALIDLQGNIQPFVTIEIGSCTVCFRLDDRGGCETFRSARKAAKFRRDQEAQGARITKHVCD